VRAVRQNQPRGPFVLEEVPEPALRDDRVVVQIEAAPVLSYHREVLSGALGYAMPTPLYTPGTDALGTVARVGSGVLHVAPGERVAIDPRYFVRENVPEPEGMLLALPGLTAGSHRLQELVRDGTWAEQTALPADMVTPLPGQTDTPAEDLVRLCKFPVCYGGLVRGRLSGGETVVVSGATGNFGAPAVPLAVAMGAARVIALGRNQTVLEQLGKLDPRVIPVALTGEVERDTAAIRDAAPGGAHLALDLVGHANDSRGIQAMVGALRRRGRLVIQGSMDVPLELPYGLLMVRDIELLGAFMYPRYAFERLVDLVCVGALDLSCVEVQAFPLDQIDAAIERASETKGLGYVVVTP